jgi:hypothetical protein
LHVVPVDLVGAHEDDRSAEVTSFPVEKGANINDHIIQQADVLTLELVQTQTPMPSPTRPGAAWTAPANFTTKLVKIDVRTGLFRPASPEKLKVQPNAFKPGGLLAISSAVGGAITSLTNAIGLTSAPTDPTTQPTMRAPIAEDVSANVFQTSAPVDRIGQLHDTLIDVKEKGRFCQVVFRGKIYQGYILKRVRLTSAKKEVGLGRFTLELQKVHIVETAVANLPDPSSLRLKPVKAQVKPPKPVDPKVAEDIIKNHKSASYQIAEFFGLIK